MGTAEGFMFTGDRERVSLSSEVIYEEEDVRDGYPSQHGFFTPSVRDTVMPRRTVTANRSISAPMPISLRSLFRWKQPGISESMRRPPGLLTESYT
ncbi:hypothetical protein NXW09_29535 [Bacteroides ovatus]|nr:hypothetical protein [Bacteroides ovatus]